MGRVLVFALNLRLARIDLRALGALAEQGPPAPGIL